jgi:putative ABC transport system permease protein
METLWHDIRYGLRLLRKNGAFTVVAVLTLALGIGANAAIFSVVYGVLLKPLPYRDPDRLHMVFHDNRRLNDPRYAVSYFNYRDLRDQSRTFEDLAAVSPVWNIFWSEPEGPVQVAGHWVTHTFCEVLGVKPALGRCFTAEEDRDGAPMVALLSHRYWRERWGGDPGVVGRVVAYGTHSATIVGVMPRGFRFLEEVDIWLPLDQNPFAQMRRSIAMNRVVGHLKRGVTREQARAEMTTLMAALGKQYPDSNAGLGAVVVPLHEETVGKVRTALLVLLGVVGFLLLIAVANVANLMLTRAAARGRKIAVRMALGANRWRLVRQLLTESVLLASVGGLGGWLMAHWGLAALRLLAPANLPRLHEVAMDAPVFFFLAGASVLTGILFGLAPALQATRASLNESLKEGGRTTAGGAAARTRGLLAATEIALALVVLTGAGLLLRSFAALMDVDPGFDPRNLWTLQMQLPPVKYNDAQVRAAFYQQAFRRLEALPGAISAGGVTRLPLGTGVSTRLEIEGRGQSEAERAEVQFRRASVNYFRTMGIPLLAGRGFTDADNLSAPPVAVVNQTLARQVWPQEDPLGKRVRLFADPNAPWFTIVGVMGDVKHFGLDTAAQPEVYMPFDQGPPTAPALAVRTAGNPAAHAGAVRQTLRTLEPELVIYDVAAMDRRVSQSVAQRRFNLISLGGFAALAVALAAIGVYGVISYSVAQRTHEIGVRMALGAEQRDILAMVVRNGMRLTLAGLAVGLALALALTRFLGSLLYGVRPTNPVTFALVVVLLAAVAFVACYVPARRATRVDPMVALRYE